MRRSHRLDAEADTAPSLIDAELRVPSGEAMRLAVGFGLCVAFLTVLVIFHTYDTWWTPFVRGAVAGVGTALFAYVVLFGLFTRDERADRKRARGVGEEAVAVAAIPPEPQRHLVTIRLDDDRSSRYVHDIPMSVSMRRFAKGTANGTVAFAERSAAECGVSRDDFLTLRDQLLERGIVAWKNADSPRAGYTFGHGFAQAMRALADYPLPEGE